MKAKRVFAFCIGILVAFAGGEAAAQYLRGGGVPEKLGRAAGLSEDRKTLLIASPRGVEMWDAEKATLVSTTPFAVGRTLGLVVSDDRRFAVVNDYDHGEGAAKVVDLKSGEAAFRVRALSAAAFSADSTKLAAIVSTPEGACRLRVIEAAGGKVLYEYELSKRPTVREVVHWKSAEELVVVAWMSADFGMLGAAKDRDFFQSSVVALGRGVVESSAEVPINFALHPEYGVVANHGRRVCFCARQAFVFFDVPNNKIVTMVKNTHHHRCLVSGYAEDDFFLLFWPHDQKVGFYDASKDLELDLETRPQGSDVWAVLAGEGGRRLRISDDSVSVVVPRE